MLMFSCYLSHGDLDNLFRLSSEVEIVFIGRSIGDEGKGGEAVTHVFPIYINGSQVAMQFHWVPLIVEVPTRFIY